jgi:hypothetical protein
MFGRYSDDKPISIIITTLAAHSYENEMNLADTLFGVLAGMDRHIEERDGVVWIENPVDPLENFADKWADEPQKEKRFNEWLERARDDFDALASLRSPADIDEQTKEKLHTRTANKALNEVAPIQIGENFLQNQPVNVRPIPIELATAPHKQQPRWAVRLSDNHKVEIVEARAGRSRWRSSRIRSNDKPLPKGCNLRFRAKTNVSSPYEIYWQVVNTGMEAQALGANGLRGEIEQKEVEEGGLIKKEETQYTGTHSIECFVVKDGVVVAKSGQFVVNIV